jgi:predicted flavoprotein YhiN
MKQVIVIGGGPSGMMAAISSARSGAKVTLLEAGQKPGRLPLLPAYVVLAGWIRPADH